MVNKIVVRLSAFCVVCSTLFFLGCSNNEEPQPVDCSVSGLTISLTTSNPTACGTANGSITATAEGGDAPYQFALDAQAYSNNSNFTGLMAGNYVVKAKDKNGCERTKNVSINSPGSTLAATVSATQSGCKTNAGSISVNATGGSSPYTYQLNSGTASSTTSFSNLASGTYSVKVTDNAGCTTTQSIRVMSGVSFSATIKAIIDANCAVSGCHSTNGGSVAFTNFSAIQSRAADIKARTQSGDMPKNGPKLPQAELDAIACWVDDGAPNN